MKKSAWIVPILILLNVASVYACQCDHDVPVCAHYSNATNVFSGKVVSVKAIKFESTPIQEVRFRVLKKYKGLGKRFLVVRFLETECRKKFERLRTYLVFDENARFHDACNATETADTWSSDVLTVADLANKSPAVSLSGSIRGLTASEIASASLFWSPGGNAFGEPIRQSGEFLIGFPGYGSYSAKLFLPIPITKEVSVQSLSKPAGTAEITKDERGYTIKLRSELRSNGCDARRIIVRDK